MSAVTQLMRNQNSCRQQLAVAHVNVSWYVYHFLSDNQEQYLWQTDTAPLHYHLSYETTILICTICADYKQKHVHLLPVWRSLPIFLGQKF
jgi:hypothetical protein